MSRPWLPLLPVLALFLLVGTRRLDLPGLWPDEASDAVYGLEVARGLPPSDNDWSLSFAGRTWPLRTPHPYDFSAFNPYLAAVAFRLGGVGVESLRLAALLVAAAGIAAVYALALPFLGAGGAVVAALFLALDPAYLLHARVGFFAAELFLVAPTVAAAALAWRWRRGEGGPASLCFAAFLLGASLNVSTKALAPALAYPLAFLAAAGPGRRPSRRLLLAAAAAAALGAANFLAFNALRGAEVPRALAAALTAPTAAGVDNLSPAANLGARLAQLARLMTGAAAPAADPPPLHLALPLLFLASFAALAWRCRRDFAGRPLVVFALLAASLQLLMTAFTPMSLDPQHLLVLWPCVAVLLAAAAAWLAETVERAAPGRGRLAAGAALALLLASAARTDAAYFARLGETGGLGAWSDASYRLAAELDREAAVEPVALAWGVAQTVFVLTEGRVKPVAIGVARRSVPERGYAALEERAQAPGARFITAAPEGDAARAYLDRLRRSAAESGRRLVASYEAADRAGRPVYRVWRLAP
ncbi:MAG: hypothetical protein SF051_02765 [Elusimicrobiota bacterium]|nr:hypothetical protein [Elusimicrobiota bacterium]